jgi:ABC-type antimicrobial peptide transport system permease subunit
MTGLLFGVQPIDVWTFGAVALITAVVACLACLVPAFRAAAVDPANALRIRSKMVSGERDVPGLESYIQG